MTTKVAVIGAGALGLMAMKNFVEDGFDVTGFEARDYVGGLWKDSADSTISVHATTRFNSSKYRCGMTDFPFPEHTDDFPTAVQMHEYLVSYSDHFGLTSRVRLGTKVTNLERVDSKWALTVQPRDGPPRVEYFDKVAVSTGSFFKPKTPKLKDVEKFAGDVLHSIDYHGPEPYTHKNVLIIGIHASAQDVAASLQETAKKVYMSHRHGLTLLPRYMPDGSVFDASAGLRFVLILTFMTTWCPRLWNWVFDKLIQSISRSTFKTKPEWNFQPTSSMAVSTPLVGDKLYAMLTSGFAIPVSEVARITGPRSVELTDGTEINDIDAIITCTGYDFEVSFIPQSSPYQPYPKLGEPPNLYRNTFPLDPDPSVRNSLVILGQAAIPLPGFSQFELVAQAVSQIWQGKAKLPPLSEMKKWHRENLAWRDQMTKLYGHSSTFYTAFIPFDSHIRWLDSTAGTGIFANFDWAWFNWRSWRLWWQDRDLYNICMSGLMTPAIWRLFDCGGRKPWNGAREQIFRDNEAQRRQKERKLKEMQAEHERDKGMNGHAAAQMKKVR